MRNKYCGILLFVFIFSLNIFAQSSNYIYNRDTFLNPGNSQVSPSVGTPKVIKYPFTLGPRIGILAGGAYMGSFSPYVGLFFEMPFNRFVGAQINANYHQYGLMIENAKWTPPSSDSRVPIGATANGGYASLNYIEVQAFFKVYIDKFWIGAGVGINVFIGGRIIKFYRGLGYSPPIGSSVSDDIQLLSETVRSETSPYLYFSLGRVTQITPDIFLYPEVYTRLFVLGYSEFLNQNLFIIGANFGLGYRF